MKDDACSGLNDLSPLFLLHRAGQFADNQFVLENKAVDITPRQFAVLSCVARNKNLSQSDIVNKTGIDRSTLADIVRRLSGQGLLERSRTREDARRYAVRLTQKGSDLFNQVQPAATAADNHILSCLHADDRKALLDALCRIVKTMDSRTRAATNKTVK